MAREIVKYDNKLNSISFSGTGITDNLVKLFYTIVAKARDNGTEIVTITFDEMRRLTADKAHYTDQEYKELVKKLYHVLLSLRINYDEGENFGEHNIFIGYDSSLDDKKIKIKTTPAAQHLFNNIEYNFTRFELNEFVNLPGGIYAKQLYRLLKQYRHLGECSMLIKDIRKYMDVPETYKTKDLTRRVIAPACTTLINNVPEFITLRFEYSYSGRKAIRVRFHWTPEKRYKDQQLEKEMKKRGYEYDGQKKYYYSNSR